MPIDPKELELSHWQRMGNRIEAYVRCDGRIIDKYDQDRYFTSIDQFGYATVEEAFQAVEANYPHMECECSPERCDETP